MTLESPSTQGLGASSCFRLRVPGLVDLVITGDADQITWLNQHPDVTRPLDRRASLLHRLAHARLTRDLSFDGAPLPVFLAREDAQRAARQTELVGALQGADESQERDEMARYVAGLTSSDIGAVVQQWCGRLFSERYRSTPDSYAAGRLLAEWPAAPPWKTLSARLSGRLRRAKQTLSEAADADRHCIHATSIGMENIARTLREMRRVARLPEMETASANRALARCLRAPPAVLRGCRAQIVAPFLAEPLTPRTLVVFLVARAFARSGDLDVAFLSGTWSGCPAHEVVPDLLREAWHAARDGKKQPGELWSARVKPWGRVLMRAVSAFEGRAS